MQIAGALFIHALPALVLLIVLLISLKYEIVGGIALILAGLLYVALLMRNPFQWYYVIRAVQISGITFFIGTLFLVGWFKKNAGNNEDQFDNHKRSQQP